MSERTAASLAAFDRLAPQLEALAPHADTERLSDEMAALRRAIQSFHLEAIRFRYFNVERLLVKHPERYPAAALATFEELRRELETAGFHTRSHAAP